MTLHHKTKRQLEDIPDTPGVYHFLNTKGQIIYVGKASDLKKRVASYFKKNTGLSTWKQRMVPAIAKIDWIETETEIEALLLEANHIKKYAPYYNVTMRDDKNYQYIKVSTDEEWPRVLSTRTIDKSGTYFGPFTSGYAVKETLRVLRKIIPFRCKQKPIEASDKSDGARGRTSRACLQFHIGLCPGTCVGAITNKEYQKNIKVILSFLSGKHRVVIRAVKRKLGKERAAYVDNLLAHTRVLSLSEKYASDVRELKRAIGLPVLPRRIEGYDISNTMGKEATGSMVVFVEGEPANDAYKKFTIKTVKKSNDVGMLKEILERRLAHNDWPLPDLMVIDGGKGQLNVAVRALKKARLDVPVLSIAKGGHGGVLKQKDEIYFPGEKTPLKLPKSSPALHLVMRVRDEAHRFAIGHHKFLRKKKFLPIK
jgi:excinuclease ABC subunit C